MIPKFWIVIATVAFALGCVLLKCLVDDATP